MATPRTGSDAGGGPTTSVARTINGATGCVIELTSGNDTPGDAWRDMMGPWGRPWMTLIRHADMTVECQWQDCARVFSPDDWATVSRAAANAIRRGQLQPREDVTA